MTTYRLPTVKGKENSTKDADLYIEIWRSLGDRVCIILNQYTEDNWRLSSWDPGILLVATNSERTLDLPDDIALAIVMANYDLRPWLPRHYGMLMLHEYFRSNEPVS